MSTSVSGAFQTYPASDNNDRSLRRRSQVVGLVWLPSKVVSSRSIDRLRPRRRLDPSPDAGVLHGGIGLVASRAPPPRWRVPRRLDPSDQACRCRAAPRSPGRRFHQRCPTIDGGTEHCGNFASEVDEMLANETEPAVMTGRSGMGGQAPAAWSDRSRGSETTFDRKSTQTDGLLIGDRETVHCCPTRVCLEGTGTGCVSAAKPSSESRRMAGQEGDG